MGNSGGWWGELADREHVRSGVAKVNLVLLGLDRSGLERLYSLLVSWTSLGEGMAIV